MGLFVRGFVGRKDGFRLRDGGVPMRGFTLLEIMLVLVIISVSTMMVMPSYFSAFSGSLGDEGKRLVQVLRLAKDESALSGQNYRVRFRAHSYSFQSTNQHGEWHTLQASPYQPHDLGKAFQILEIRPQPPLTEQVDSGKEKREPVMADLLLPPEGIRQISDIILANDPDDGHALTIHFRPGPGGIDIASEMP